MPKPMKFDVPVYTPQIYEPLVPKFERFKLRNFEAPIYPPEKLFRDKY